MHLRSLIVLGVFLIDMLGEKAGNHKTFTT